MKKMQFNVAIHATKEKVWKTMWQDETFRQWAGIIDPGTYLIGKLEEGAEVQFISGNGYGVTSLVDSVTENEFLLLKHQADTQDKGARERDHEWTGGDESYVLSEADGFTTLTASFDVPTQLEKYFEENYPKALECIKSLAEQKL